MTDQPTTWTPERALAWLKDLRDLSASEIREKWGKDAFMSAGAVAIPALESNDTEINRLRAELHNAKVDRDAYREELDERDKDDERVAAEIERLRDEVTQIEGMERQRDAETARADAAEREADRLHNSKPVIYSQGGRVFYLQSAQWHGSEQASEGMPSSVEVYGSGDMGPGEVQTYVSHREVERLRAELAAKQPVTRTPLPEAKFSPCPLQQCETSLPPPKWVRFGEDSPMHETVTTWCGKPLQELTDAEFAECFDYTSRNPVSIESVEAVANERRRRMWEKPAEAEAAQQGPSDEEIAGSIKCVWTWGCKRSAHALQLLARRAGVKL